MKMRVLFKRELSVILEAISLVSASRAMISSCHRVAFSQPAEEAAGRKMMGILMGPPFGARLEHKAIYVFINCNKYIRSAGDIAERMESKDA